MKGVSRSPRMTKPPGLEDPVRGFLLCLEAQFHDHTSRKSSKSVAIKTHFKHDKSHQQLLYLVSDFVPRRFDLG